MQETNVVHVTTAPARGAYPLGHSPAELQRLERQGAFLRELTELLLRRAGLCEGMHVLDIGCGVGDVSLLAAEIVGSSGRVLGIDRAPAAVKSAKARAGDRSNVDVTTADLEVLDIEGQFDAIIGRMVLAYLPDPAACLHRLRDHLRPGGVVAFQELVLWLAHACPEGPLLRRCTGWILDVFARSGLDIETGARLHAMFLAAGLPAPQMLVLGRAEGGWQSPVYDYIAETLRSLTPAAERLGVATADEIDADTLAARLRAEATRHDACIMPPPLVGAWTRCA
jgi:SAM-dependent methyltransferase